jgi:predicted ATPase
LNFLLGAQGTGKSTVLKELDLPLLGLEVPTRSFLKAGRDLDLENEETQSIVCKGCIALHNMINSMSVTGALDNMFFSRSLIDTIVWNEINFENSELLNPIVDEMKSIIDDHHHLMTIYYLPIEFEIEGDEFRPASKDLQKRIDDEYRKYLSKYEFKEVYELRGTVEERKNIIQESKNVYSR